MAVYRWYILIGFIIAINSNALMGAEAVNDTQNKHNKKTWTMELQDILQKPVSGKGCPLTQEGHNALINAADELAQDIETSINSKVKSVQISSKDFDSLHTNLQPSEEVTHQESPSSTQTNAPLQEKSEPSLPANNITLLSCNVPEKAIPNEASLSPSTTTQEKPKSPVPEQPLPDTLASSSCNPPDTPKKNSAIYSNFYPHLAFSSIGTFILYAMYRLATQAPKKIKRNIEILVPEASTSLPAPDAATS